MIPSRSIKIFFNYKSVPTFPVFKPITNTGILPFFRGKALHIILAIVKYFLIGLLINFTLPAHQRIRGWL